MIAPVATLATPPPFNGAAVAAMPGFADILAIEMPAIGEPPPSAAFPPDAVVAVPPALAAAMSMAATIMPSPEATPRTAPVAAPVLGLAITSEPTHRIAPAVPIVQTASIAMSEPGIVPPPVQTDPVPPARPVPLAAAAAAPTTINLPKAQAKFRGEPIPDAPEPAIDPVIKLGIDENRFLPAASHLSDGDDDEPLHPDAMSLSLIMVLPAPSSIVPAAKLPEAEPRSIAVTDAVKPALVETLASVDTGSAGSPPAPTPGGMENADPDRSMPIVRPGKEIDVRPQPGAIASATAHAGYRPTATDLDSSNQTASAPPHVPARPAGTMSEPAKASISDTAPAPAAVTKQRLLASEPALALPAIRDQPAFAAAKTARDVSLRKMKDEPFIVVDAQSPRSPWIASAPSPTLPDTATAAKTTIAIVQPPRGDTAAAPNFAITTPTLGDVSAAVTTRHDASGERLHVHFAVERDATAALIAGHDGLDRAVAATGARLDTVSVEVRGDRRESLFGGNAPRSDPRETANGSRRPPRSAPPQVRALAPARDRFA